MLWTFLLVKNEMDTIEGLLVLSKIGSIFLFFEYFPR